MKRTQIAAYARVKPCPEASLHQGCRLKYGDFEDQITIPFLNENSPNTRRFRFRKIFDEFGSQEKIFQRVAKPIIKDVLSGFNGMIFTFGQAGSGKTYTMSGNTEDYRGHGLILRTIKEVLREKKNRTIKITYCQIYNERVHDLIGNLDINLEGARLSQIKNSKVNSFRDLTVYELKSFHDTLPIFIEANKNKLVQLNEEGFLSSRSHLIFSIYFEFPCTEDGMLRSNPILFLVELASMENRDGSGTQLNWRNNNLSLVYLENVLSARKRQQKGPLSYRYSRTTNFLKNVLEGNYLVAAIATISLAAIDIEQTVETCQMAEKLEQITNVTHPCEEIVPFMKILNPVNDMQVLKNHCTHLKAQLNVFLKNQLPEKELDKDEKAQCALLVQKFISGNDINDLPDSDIRKTIYCFHLMRKQILNRIRDQSKAEYTLSDFSLKSSEYLSEESKDISETETTQKKSQIEITEENSKNFTSNFLNSLKEPESVQGNENNVSNTEINNENETMVPEAVVDSSDSLTQKPSGEYLLVHENVDDRSKLVLCIAKLEEIDTSSTDSKF